MPFPCTTIVNLIWNFFFLNMLVRAEILHNAAALTEITGSGVYDEAQLRNEINARMHPETFAAFTAAEWVCVHVHDEIRGHLVQRDRLFAVNNQSLAFSQC